MAIVERPADALVELEVHPTVVEDGGAVRAGGRPAQALPFTKNRSCRPSLSTSSTTTPDPMVSGSSFWPKAPLLCRKVTPAAAVTSVKANPGVVARCADGETVRVAASAAAAIGRRES